MRTEQNLAQEKKISHAIILSLIITTYFRMRTSKTVIETQIYKFRNLRTNELALFVVNI
jgi:hypothetical protein